MQQLNITAAVVLRYFVMFLISRAVQMHMKSNRISAKQCSKTASFNHLCSGSSRSSNNLAFCSQQPLRTTSVFHEKCIYPIEKKWYREHCLALLQLLFICICTARLIRNITKYLKTTAAVIFNCCFTSEEHTSE